jgi:hypothetical protein
LQEQVERQHVSWWKDIRREIRRIGISGRLAARFACYLSGFIAVSEREQSRRVDHDLAGNPAGSTWRKAKRYFARPEIQRVFGKPDFFSANPPHKESLKTKLIRLMTEDLVAEGYQREYTPDILTKIWTLIDAEVKAESISRTDRRSRQRTKLSN